MRRPGSIIINGRRMDFDGNGVQGREIIAAATHGDPRRRAALYKRGGEFKHIEPDRFYGSDQLRDKYGNPVQVKSFPDRSKGTREV